MTLLDKVWEFSDDQDIAASTLSSGATVVSTNVVDLGNDMKDTFGTAVATQNIGAQFKRPVLVLQVGAEAFTGAGATVQCKLVSKASSASISSGGTEHARVTFSALSAIGTKKEIPIPDEALNRYVGVLYTASGGNLTAGYMNAFLAEAAQRID